MYDLPCLVCMKKAWREVEVLKEALVQRDQEVARLQVNRPHALLALPRLLGANNGWGCQPTGPAFGAGELQWP